MSFLSPAIRYFSEAHLPRSMIRHRSEQNGLYGLSSHVVLFLHTGHMIVLRFIPLHTGALKCVTFFFYTCVILTRMHE